MARVLIVEDDGDIARLLARRLRSYGHNVLVAPTGGMAMRLVGIDFPVEVVIMDINLPGDRGFEVLEQLRRHPELDNPGLPAVFLSGSSDPSDEERAHAMGATFLRKPFVSGELQGAILHATAATA